MGRAVDESRAGAGVALRCAARVRGVRAYAPPAKSAGVDVFVDANEGARTGAGVVEALRSVDAEVLRRYPDAAALEARLAEMHGVGRERVVVTNGGDEAIDRVCRAFLEQGRALVTHEPTFVMVPRYAGLAGAAVRGVRWVDGAFPLDEMVARVGCDVGVVSVVSPANPTGRVVPLSAMVALADAAAGVGGVLLADLAYVEFGDGDETGALVERENVVVVRTFSKAYGLAGLRIGYAVTGSRAVSGWLRAAGGPFPVSVGAVAAAGAALDDGERVRGYVGRVREERERLTGVLRECGVEVFESGGNFVAGRFGDAEGAGFVHSALLSMGVSVRRFGAGSGAEDLLRITVPGDAAEFERVCGALRVVLRPEAVLLDMDGVLADVSGSYRRAIVETAGAFGAAVSDADVAAKKREGGWNDDWELTHALVREAGVDAPFEEVVSAFQHVYLGEGGAGGLRETEGALVKRGVLEGMRGAGLRLGVVTGRPREEAMWFIERMGWEGVFGVVVAMGDAGEKKPSGVPVRAAMGSLGVERAWLVGDTVDDVAAARAAGALAVGVVAPEDDADATRGAMAGAGGHLVMDGGVESVWERLREVLA